MCAQKSCGSSTDHLCMRSYSARSFTSGCLSAICCAVDALQRDKDTQQEGWSKGRSTTDVWVRLEQANTAGWGDVLAVDGSSVSSALAVGVQAAVPVYEQHRQLCNAGCHLAPGAYAVVLLLPTCSNDTAASR
jgi:hypothetical protein